MIIVYTFVSADEIHLFDIEAELIDIAHKWKRVGRALRLRPSLHSQSDRKEPTRCGGLSVCYAGDVAAEEL